MTDLGPVDVVVLAFPGNVGDVMVPALELVEASEDIRLIDALVVAKDQAGEVTGTELEEQPELRELAAKLPARGAFGLLGTDDIREVGLLLEPGNCALALLIEHMWARDVSRAVRNGKGRLLATVRIPEESIAAAELALIQQDTSATA